MECRAALRHLFLVDTRQHSKVAQQFKTLRKAPHHHHRHHFNSFTVTLTWWGMLSTVMPVYRSWV